VFGLVLLSALLRRWALKHNAGAEDDKKTVLLSLKWPFQHPKEHSKRKKGLFFKAISCGFSWLAWSDPGCPGCPGCRMLGGVGGAVSDGRSYPDIL